MICKKYSTNYANAAVDAVYYIEKNTLLSPLDAWQMAISQHTNSKEARKKGCPKTAFLGLCEDGLVKGIRPNDYIKKPGFIKNKQYVLIALELLKKEPSLVLDKKELWRKVKAISGSTSEGKDGHMDVVIALFSEGLLC
jgi:hypothetical protein